MKNNLMKFLFLLFVFLDIYAIKLDELINKMKMKEETIKNIRFSYTQTITYKIINQTYTISGEVVFEKPNKLLMRFIEPEKQILFANEDDIKIYTQKTNKLLKLKWKDLSKIFAIPLHFFPHNIKVENIKRSILRHEETNSYYVLTLSMGKKRKEKNILVLYLDKDELIPLITKLHSPEYESSIELKSWEINFQINENTFKFDIPSDVEIIHWK